MLVLGKVVKAFAGGIWNIASDMFARGKILRNEPMARYTTFRIGGKADIFFVPEDEEDLKRGVAYALEKELPWFMLGNGSNILVSDQGIRGLVIHLEKPPFRQIHFEKNTATVGAGLKTATVLHDTIQKNFGGLEFLAAVPGTMGGVFYMNAGTYLGEIASAALEIRFLDESLKTRTLPKSELNYRYRKSIFQEKPWVILDGKIALTPMAGPEAQAKVTEVFERRRKTQPLGLPSAGSGFKNPPNHSAWKLIEDAGLRGFSIGDAAVSELHCNFMINKGGASASQMLQLMRHVQETVLEKFGILLEPEIRLSGDWEEDFRR